MGVKDFYRNNHSKLMWIPLIIILISIGILGFKYFTTGEFIQKDVSLKGGISTTISTTQEVDAEDLAKFLTSKLNEEVSVRTLRDFTSGDQVGVIIETSNVKSSDLKAALKEKITFTDEDFSVEEVSASLGESFFRQMIIAVIVAFVLISLTVLVMFRTLIPSLGVVSAALFDMLFSLSILSLFEVKLTSAGVAAFLLVMGYSIDTDILLTTRVLKRSDKELFERIFDSMKTGSTMSITAIVSLTIGYFFATSLVLKQIFLIIILALIFDLFTTWLLNTEILIRYCKKKNIT
ncbi:MAG: hypothetical protein HYS32_02620 [Candidatus Woesearchaeota archaeon]|nr:MAG: hypothetical protein HYS32_02620 [Candidatus Woesearchaeota archaeon]